MYYEGVVSDIGFPARINYKSLKPLDFNVTPGPTTTTTPMPPPATTAGPPGVISFKASQVGLKEFNISWQYNSMYASNVIGKCTNGIPCKTKYRLNILLS